MSLARETLASAQSGAQETARLKRKIAAIVAADVVGYSRLVAEDEEGTLRDLAASREIFDGLVAQGGGRIFNTAGDSVMCEFDSAVEAVRVAIAIQDALARRCLEAAPARRLQFRMGVTIGDVVERDGDLLGDGVNMAARLEALAEPGGICVSRSVHEAIANKVEAEFRDLGPRQVKNIPLPVHAFAVIRAEPAARAETPVHALDIRAERRGAGGTASEPRSGRRWPIAALVVVAAAGAGSYWAWATRGPGSDGRMAEASRPAELPGVATPVEIVPQVKSPATAPAAKPPVSTPPAAGTPATPPLTVTPARAAATPPRQATEKPAAATTERPPLPADATAAFAALARDGVIADARTLPEMYHNARIQEMRGDRAAAQKSYAAAVPMAGDAIDPAWRYGALLRARSPENARRLLGDLARDAPSRGAQAIAASLVESLDGRSAALQAVAAAHSDYAPVDYLIADALLSRPGGPTITDRRIAYDALERFVDSGPRLAGFFVDRAVAETWLETARKRRGEIEAAFAGSARPSAAFSRGESGWLAKVTLPEPGSTIALRVGERGELAAPAAGQAGDRPTTSADFNLPATIGRTTLYATYRDSSGSEAGPFPITFDPALARMAAARDTLERFPESWIQFRTDLPDIIAYPQLVTNRCGIGRALIGYDDEPPTKAIPLPVCDAVLPAEVRPVLTLPAGVQSVQVKLAYADGTESPVRRFDRP